MSQKSTETETTSTTESNSGSGQFFYTGKDADQIGPMFAVWMKELEEKFDVVITSYHSTVYFSKRNG